MIGVSMKITTTDTIEDVVMVTPKAAIAFERHFKIALAKALTEDQRMEYIYWLAWEALKAAGRTVKLFDGWVEQVAKVEFVFDGDDTPGKDATT